MTKTLTQNTDYSKFLNQLKSRIQSAQISASRVLNKGLVSLYWSIGRDIVEKQELLGWGKAVVERFAQEAA